MSSSVKNAYFERCSLVIEADSTLNGAVRLVKNDGSVSVEPSFSVSQPDFTSYKFDFASGFGGKVVPSGKYSLSGVSLPQNIELSADFSGSGTTYTINIANGEIEISYIPKKESLADAFLNFGINALYSLGRLHPNKHKRIVFSSESRQDLSGNMVYVLKKAGELGLTDGKEIILSFIKGNRWLFYARCAILLGSCNTVVADDYFPLINRLHFSEKARIFQLWHACGAYKTVGYSRLGKIGAPRIDGPSHRCYTHAIVSSEAMRRHYAEAFGIRRENVYATGIPRTDVFFDKDYAETMKSNLLTDYPLLKGKRVMLFAPTFRGNGKHSAHYPQDAVDLERLAQFCRDNGWVTIFKMHPFVNNFELPDEYSDVFLDLRSHREINDLLFCADLLITDYSSVIYEASLLDINMLFYVFDIDEYTASRDFYEPFEKYLAGKCVHSFDELLSALESGEFDSQKALAFRAYSMEACDGAASERVARLIFGA